MLIRYIQPPGSSGCELQLVPERLSSLIRAPRSYLPDRPELAGLPDRFKPMAADQPGSLVELKCAEDDAGAGFSNGMTMTGSPTRLGLEYESQSVFQEPGQTIIVTTLKDHQRGFRCLHYLTHRRGDNGVRCSVELVNDSDRTWTLELLSSFGINGLTPFFDGNATDRLVFHRFRSWWSMEGKRDSQRLTELHLERSWAGFGRLSERFGQVGTMPVRKWFPFAAVEDTSAGVVWAAQLAWAGSWQMELFRTGDRVHLCGGLADREFGHWQKRIKPGERFKTPEAAITVLHGNLDQACQRLTAMQRTASIPKEEQTLPVGFNEWCTSWGNPTAENILAIARRLQGTGVRYVVMDDGWAVRPPEATMQSNGDWVVDQTKFPGGLKATCDALREMGFIPGLWFEFEVINPGATCWTETAHMVHRDGRPLQVGSRRFWDFTDPWVSAYLTERVIRLLSENGIGYLKVDYNDNLGLGCDHPDSLGEGLRRQVEGIQLFFKKIRESIPEIVIENCSSGGHRLEPSMQQLVAMGSFSDAHEPVIIPMIARNLQRLILPSQSLIWAVLHRRDDRERLVYSLAATFLGRMCLSGEIHDLYDWQMDLVREAVRFYQRVSKVIDRGVSFFYGAGEENYVDPVGWQAVVRVAGSQVLVVLHQFGEADKHIIRVGLPEGNWSCAEAFVGDEVEASIHPNTEVQPMFVTQKPRDQDFASAWVGEPSVLKINIPSGFRAGVWLLERVERD